jgi:O-antigen ligase
VPIGRAEHQILGAGGLAACLFAGMALFGRTHARYKPLVAAGIAVIALTIIMTQSRGPILATTLALGATFFVCRLPSPAARMKAACSLVLVCYLVPMALVIAEPWLRDLICASGINICRPSYRQDIWSRVLEVIAERPLFGVGPNFRFSGGVINHPHNGLLGVIFFFGLPMGLLFVAILYVAVKQAVAGSRSEVQMFALLGVLFSTGMMATDLSNPFAFLNTHYLYLWLPVFVGSIPDALWAGRAAPAGQVPTSQDAPAHGLRHQAAGC